MLGWALGLGERAAFAFFRIFRPGAGIACLCVGFDLTFCLLAANLIASTDHCVLALSTRLKGTVVSCPSHRLTST